MAWSWVGSFVSIVAGCASRFGASRVTAAPCMCSLCAVVSGLEVVG